MNHTLFVEMAALVRRELPDVRSLVVGNGDGDEQTHLEVQASRLGVQDRMHFLAIVWTFPTSSRRRIL